MVSKKKTYEFFLFTLVFENYNFIKIIGLDQFWNDGELPHVAIYWTQARQRPSVLKASLWKEHEHQYCTIDKEPNEVKQARFACYSAVALGGAYLLFRAFKK